ncbi:MAG: S9 family peptidase [Planctomycetaceae bacterium]
MHLSGFHHVVVWACLAVSAAAAETLEPGENLVADGIPEIPLRLVEDVSRYTESRSAQFFDWHPLRREMLIGTRFGNTSQVHRLTVPLGARSQLTYFREPVGNATFDPIDGRFFLLTKDQGGDEFHQIFRFDDNTQRSVLLTDGRRSQNGSWVWSANNDRIVYASTARNGSDRDLWTVNPAEPASRKLLVELSGGGWSAQDWSDDGRRILVRQYLSINSSRLHLLDVESGRLQLLTPETPEAAYDDARFGAGETIYVTTDRGQEFLRLATIKPIPDGGPAVPEFLPIEISWDIEAFEISPDRKHLAFLANVAGGSQLYFMDLNGDPPVPERIDAWPLCQMTLGRWRSDSNEFAVTVSAPEHPSDVYSVDIGTRQVTRWTQSELGGIVADELAPARLIEWPSFDGRTISGFLYRSPKFAGKRPVIVNIHGGPEGQSRPMFLGRSNYFIAELGVAMIYPNVRGSAGYGRTFLKLDDGLLREDSVKDIGALLDWIREQPDLDAERVMITGGSYGGYMTLACATHFNDRIAAALDVVGISHFGTFLKNTESYRRDLRRVEYGDERDPAIAEFFERTAPLNNAHKIAKPLFVVQGGNDPRVPATESAQMVSRVKQNGSSVWYLLAKDEGHGFRKKANADFQFYATVLFVRQFLLSP